MEGQIEQAILEALRMGAEPKQLQNYLNQVINMIEMATYYKPDSKVAVFYQALHDAKFRP